MNKKSKENVVPFKKVKVGQKFEYDKNTWVKKTRKESRSIDGGAIMILWNTETGVNLIN